MAKCIKLNMFQFLFSAENSIVKSNIDILVSNGLGPRAHQDFLLAFNTCSALLKLTVKKKVRIFFA